MAKARQPIALSLETLSNQSMNESKSSTIGRFTGLSSVYPQLHNRDTFSVLNSFNRFAAKNKQVHPHHPNPGQLNSENVIPQIAIELLFFVSYPFSTIESQQRSVFSASIRPIDRFPARNDRPTPQDTNPRRLSSQNAKSEMHELNLGQSSILAVHSHLAATR